MKKQLMILMGLLLVLTSCENMEGFLDVLGESISLKDKDGRTREIGRGDHSGTIVFKSKKRFYLKLKINGKRRKFEFRIPSGTRLPRENGEIFLTADQVRQNYDVQGLLKTREKRGPKKWDREFCTYQRRIKVCDRDGVCRSKRKTFTGQQDVLYYEMTTRRNLNITLLIPSSSDIMATFKGANSIREKIYEYQGICS